MTDIQVSNILDWTEEIKADVLQYNERDCYSTWCLLEWLKGLLV